MTRPDRPSLSAAGRYTDIQPETLADLTGLCEIAALACDVPNAAVHLIDDRYQRRIASVGVDPGICLREESMCSVTITAAEDVYLRDASTDRRFRDNPWVSGTLGRVRLYAAAILWTRERQPIGTLCLFDEIPRELPWRRLDALHTLARQVVDVLELQFQSRRLEASLDDVARAQEQLTAFAGQVSHDLKTPLTTTLGFAELLSENAAVQADDDAARYAAHCVDAAGRMIDMVDGLLAFSRVGATLHVRTVSLDEIVPAVVSDLGALVGDAEIRWHGTDVRADPLQLRALVQNLVTNALKYRRPDVRSQIEIVAGELDGRSRITVADNGPGIPPERRADALTPLRRLRTDVPGTGLGLATCVRIAAVHGGSIELDETPGGGTTVLVELGA